MPHFTMRKAAVGALLGMLLSTSLGLAVNHAQPGFTSLTPTPMRRAATEQATAAATEDSPVILFEGVPTGYTEEGYPLLGDPQAVTFTDFSDFL
jgi:hypothetical protein